VSLFEYVRHPHVERRKKTGPATTAKARGGGWNAKIGLAITTLVGTMICGYVFAAIALLSLPSAISSHNLTIIIAWVSSNFLQLVLLPVIIVGQNIQAKASDQRAVNTYEDAEAVLHEALQIQQHLAAQDEVLTNLATRLNVATEGGLKAVLDAVNALGTVPADAKAARAAAESAFVATQALAALATAKPGMGGSGSGPTGGGGGGQPGIKFTVT
jgi:hypothetical protein